MPCDQVRQVSVKWSDATDLELVERALKAMGALSVTRTPATVYFTDARGFGGTLSAGTLRVAQGFDVNALKQDYACRVIEDRFEAQGWDVEETTAVTPAWARS